MAKGEIHDAWGEPSKELKGWPVKEENVPELEDFMEIVKRTEKKYRNR